MIGKYTIAESPGFVADVIQQIEQPVKSIEKKTPIIRLAPYIAAASLTLLGILLAGLYFNEGSLSTEILLGVQDIRPEDAVVLLTN